MRTLYIDTSSSFLYSAIVEDNKILGENVSVKASL